MLGYGRPMTRNDIVWLAEVLGGMYMLVTGVQTSLLAMLGHWPTGLITLLIPAAGLWLMTQRPLTALVFAGNRAPRLASEPEAPAT
jgi:hypothetical protein